MKIFDNLSAQKEYLEQKELLSHGKQEALKEHLDYFANKKINSDAKHDSYYVTKLDVLMLVSLVESCDLCFGLGEFHDEGELVKCPCKSEF